MFAWNLFASICCGHELLSLLFFEERFCFAFSVAVAVNMAVVVEGMYEIGGEYHFLLRDQLSLCNTTSYGVGLGWGFSGAFGQAVCTLVVNGMVWQIFAANDWKNTH